MKTFKTYILFFILLFTFLGCEKLKDENIIKIGIVPPYPPFSFFEENELRGFEVELANLISKKLDKKSQIIILGQEGYLAALKNKFIDTIIGIYPIELRKKEFIFSDVYLEQGFILIFKKGNNITKENFSKKRIGSILLSGPYEFFKKNYKFLNEIIYLNSNSDGIININYDLIDAFAFFEYSGKFIAKKNNFDYIKFDDPENQGHTFMFRKEDSVLRYKINGILKTLKENGELDKLRKKYDLY